MKNEGPSLHQPRAGFLFPKKILDDVEPKEIFGHGFESWKRCWIINSLLPYFFAALAEPIVIGFQ